MEHLIIGLYVLSLLACVICLWFWYELEAHKDHVSTLHHRVSALDARVEELEKRRR